MREIKKADEKDLQEFDDITGAKNSMSDGKLRRFRGREIGSQYTSLGTSPSQNLAGRTWTENNGRGWCRRRRRRRRLRKWS